MIFVKRLWLRLNLFKKKKEVTFRLSNVFFFFFSSPLFLLSSVCMCLYAGFFSFRIFRFRKDVWVCSFFLSTFSMTRIEFYFLLLLLFFFTSHFSCVTFVSSFFRGTMNRKKKNLNAKTKKKWVLFFFRREDEKKKDKDVSE